MNCTECAHGSHLSEHLLTNSHVKEYLGRLNWRRHHLFFPVKPLHAPLLICPSPRATRDFTVFTVRALDASAPSPQRRFLSSSGRFPICARAGHMSTCTLWTVDLRCFAYQKSLLRTLQDKGTIMHDCGRSSVNFRNEEYPWSKARAPAKFSSLPSGSRKMGRISTTSNSFSGIADACAPIAELPPCKAASSAFLLRVGWQKTKIRSFQDLHQQGK